jgi:hypothetical protein
MIKLKNGHNVKYNEDFDQFFYDLIRDIVEESKKAINAKPDSGFDEDLLKEIMDNCIFISHQLIEISKENQSMSEFIVTGFIFNSIMMVLTNQNLSKKAKDSKDDDNTVH